VCWLGIYLWISGTKGEQGKTIVFISHALDAVKNLCQRSLLLNDGRIVSLGATEKVINDYLAILSGRNFNQAMGRAVQIWIY